MRFNFVALFFTVTAVLPLRAQQTPEADKRMDDYYASPFSLPVAVYFPQHKTDPVHASFIYREVRSIPNVVVVGQNPQMELRISLSQSGRLYVITTVVLKPANPAFRDIVADNVESKLHIQGTPEWRKAGDLIRNQVMSMDPAYFFAGALTYAGTNANDVINTAMKAFDANYVEPQRVLDHDTKERLKAADYQGRNAKTPEEKRAAFDNMRKLLGLPDPKQIAP